MVFTLFKTHAELYG